MHLKIKRGLDLPLLGQPSGLPKELPQPRSVALDLDPFHFVRFTLLKKPGDQVAIGEPLLADRACPDCVFVSPASGTFESIIRGLKRRILRLIITCDQANHYFDHRPFKGGDLLSHLMKGGLFPHIIVRPCHLLPNIRKKPEAIFVKAITSAPYELPPELELQNDPPLFQKGLTALASLAPTHLVTQPQSPFLTFSDVEIHTAEGPHPISHPSLHIAAIHPITSHDQAIWTLSVSDVIAVGLLVSEGKYYHKQMIAVAGEGISEDRRGFFKAFRGYPIRSLIGESCKEKNVRLLSGHPLIGSEVTPEEYLKFFDTTFCALPQPEEKRRLCHFLRLEAKSYTSTRAYIKKKNRGQFTTSQHGDARAFIDGTIYKQVMPLNIPVMHLIKAILAEDYELARSLGLLSVSPEDFALPAFICPSKIEMVEIIRRGLSSYAEQYL